MTSRLQPQRKPSRPSRGRPPLGAVERMRILGVTAAVFLEKGFARANTNEIARRARTSKQTLYALFPTKADLFVGVIGAHTERLFARHPYYIASEKPPRMALNEIGQTVLGMFTNPEFQALYRIVVAEAQNFPYLARQLRRECSERGYALLAEYLRSRRIGRPNYRRAADRFVSLVLGDFLLNGMLNPNLAWSRRAVLTRVHCAVDDFFLIYPQGEIR
jgi:TetR/AcrR family transcriptional regulator, mexJK operon transcriptional repressor